MANTIKMKQSSVASKVPLTTDLSLGELAVNTYDGKLYLKKNVSGTETVLEVGSGTFLPLTGGTLTGEVKVAPAGFTNAYVTTNAPSTNISVYKAQIGGVDRVQVGWNGVNDQFTVTALNTSGTTPINVLKADYNGSCYISANNVVRITTTTTGATVTGTLNATTELQENGVSLSTKYAPIGGTTSFVSMAKWGTD